MRTTVDLPDALIQEAKAMAIEHRTTLRALIEKGLRIALDDLRKAKGDKARERGVGTQPTE